MSNNISFMSVSQISSEIRAGRISSADVMRSVLKQIGKHNESINAIVTLDEKKAIEQAEGADKAFKKGELLGELHGIPVTIKDFFKTDGIRTTAGTIECKDYVPGEDATVVRRLREAGAIILGKTNMPPMAMDCQTDNQLFGRTNNPWNTNRTSGGSSGGGAAAVASGMSFIDIGNDLLGSVRIPSNFCGIYSIVPTEKLVPNTGLLIDKPNHGTLGYMMRPGIMARSAEDLKTVLEIISGPDHEDAQGIPLKRLHKTSCSIDKLRIAWSKDAGGLSVSEDVSDILNTFINKIIEQGHFVKNIGAGDFNFKLSREVFLRIFYPVLGTMMPPIICLAARYIGKAKYFDLSLKKYMEAENMRGVLISQLDKIFDVYDALLCTVTATTAFLHMKPDRYNGMAPVYKKGINVNGKEVNYSEANIGFTIPFSVTGNPVVTIPVGLSAEGLPVGVQVIGRRYEDMKLLDIASRLADIIGPIGYPPVFPRA